MNIQFLMPSDYFDKKQPDDTYADEYHALVSQGFTVHLINVEEINDAALGRLNNNIDENAKLIYRGWMLQLPQYEKLENAFGEKLVSSATQYITAHHLPNWYNELQTLTMHSIMTTEDKALNSFYTSGWNSVFIKDYVKSLKTGIGSIANSADEVQQIIDQMKHYRGYIEGGIILRQVVDLDATTETRFFVLNNQIFSNDNEPIKLPVVEKAVQALADKNLFFYSVDVVLDKNNKPWLIEIGDGQVSDYVGWEIDKFTQIFHSLQPKKSYKL